MRTRIVGSLAEKGFQGRAAPSQMRASNHDRGRQSWQSIKIGIRVDTVRLPSAMGLAHVTSSHPDTLRDRREMARDRRSAGANHARAFRSGYEGRTAKYQGLRIKQVNGQPT